MFKKMFVCCFGFLLLRGTTRVFFFLFSLLFLVVQGFGLEEVRGGF